MVNQEQHHCFQTMDRPIAIDGGLAALRLGDLGMPHLTGSKLKTSCVEMDLIHIYTMLLFFWIYINLVRI